MLQIRGYSYLSGGSTPALTSIQIGPGATLNLGRQCVSMAQRERPATLGDLHRAALLVWWERVSRGLTTVHLRGRSLRRVLVAGLWGIEVVKGDERRVVSWA